ncbi:MAG TPA: hypothetical protein VGN32_17940 [Ktedonobacterales bacterium]|nr:hypothetical protein [Ktedonobacterales bacterium]
MEQMPQTPFKLGWWSFDLGTYRPCDGTYNLYPYESLPPLDAPDETLAWLGPLSTTLDQQMDVHRRPDESRGTLRAIVTDAGKLGLTLPDAFLRLMISRELQERIPSCTACFFKLGDRIVACPGSPDGYIVRFLSDQQDCVLWYLYLNTFGEHCVLAALPELETYAAAIAGGDNSDTAAVVSNTWVCAPSFAGFIYRFWLENVIWFKLDGSDTASLTEAERGYLDHYERAKAAH